MVYGPLLDGAERVYRPRASVWRPVVLGLPASTPAAAASGAAVRVCHRVRPALVEGLLLEDEHACEAAAMARWGVGAGGANGSGASRGLPRDLSTCGRVLERRLTQAQAAEKLGLSVRQVALLCRKLRAEGPPRLVSQ